MAERESKPSVSGSPLAPVIVDATAAAFSAYGAVMPARLVADISMTIASLAGKPATYPPTLALLPLAALPPPYHRRQPSHRQPSHSRQPPHRRQPPPHRHLRRHPRRLSYRLLLPPWLPLPRSLQSRRAASR